MHINLSRKIATTAIITAISLALLLVGAIPFSPLTLIAYCACGILIYYTMSKCGIIFGLLQIAATGLLAFFLLSWLEIVWAPYIILFAPHAAIAFLLDKLKLKIKIIKYIIRYSIMLLFFNVALRGIFEIANAVLFDMDRFVSLVGGYYFVLAIIMSVVFVIYDQAFGWVFKHLAKSKILK